MQKIILLIFLLFPFLAQGATEIIVNNQSTYAVPPGSSKVLVLDLTLPEKLETIKISNLGTAQHSHISNLSIYEDGASAGWDGDESVRLTRSVSPFWGVEYASDFVKQRIFVTLDIVTGISLEKTIQVQAVVNSSTTIIGFARTILPGASQPAVPVAPSAKSGEALSTSTIRWNFMDLSNNEFGFRIKDASLKTKAESEQSDVSYLDETGLAPNTCYSGRRAFAFNDRGESFPSLIFAEVCTPAVPVAKEEVRPPDLTSEVTATSTSEVDVREVAPQVVEQDLSITIRQKIIEILQQLIQLLQQQLTILQASLFSAFEIFVNLFQ